MLQADPGRRTLLRAVGAGAVGAAALTAAGLALNGGATRPVGVLASLSGPRRWLNAEARPEQFAGRTVLVNFWTYSCINSLRPLPYLRAWARKYQDNGLVVIGAHAPEFAFEHDIDKVQRAVDTQRIPYPVVLDNDFEIWRAFGNEAWPGFFFVDASGRVRDRVFGEGNYEASERLLHRLLTEASTQQVSAEISDVAGEGVQAAADWRSIRSPETYVGYAKADNFSSRGGLRGDILAHYEAPPALRLNHWGLAGNWQVGQEYATLAAAGGSIKFRFHSRDLHMVLGREPERTPVRYRVTIDGGPPRSEHGFDTDADGVGIIDDDRMYQLVRQSREVQDRDFEVTFLDAGVRAYVFTFG